MATITINQQQYLDDLETAFHAFKSAAKESLKIQDNPTLFKLSEAQTARDALQSACSALQLLMQQGAPPDGRQLATFGLAGPLPFIV